MSTTTKRPSWVAPDEKASMRPHKPAMKKMTMRDMAAEQEALDRRSKFRVIEGGLSARPEPKPDAGGFLFALMTDEDTGGKYLVAVCPYPSCAAPVPVDELSFGDAYAAIRAHIEEAH